MTKIIRKHKTMELLRTLLSNRNTVQAPNILLNFLVDIKKIEKVKLILILYFNPIHISKIVPVQQII